MPNALEGSLFEEDYIRRTSGLIAHVPDLALTELVANAWDAGATQVSIQIPSQHGETLSIEDDGAGMTPEQFAQRWMTLGYNRLRHQGPYADSPAQTTRSRRRAYGRNGVGRHGLLCFANRYEVETSSSGTASSYIVKLSYGEEPFEVARERTWASEVQGTKLSVTVEKLLPDVHQIRNLLSARFMHDPQFTVIVNGESVPLSEHTGLLDQGTLQFAGKSATIIAIDSSKTARTKQQHGVAFWVGQRLVGEPTWSLGDRHLVDGRTRYGKRLTVVVQSDDLYDDVLADWTGFKRSEVVTELYAAAAEYVEGILRRIWADKAKEAKDAVLDEFNAEIKELDPSGQHEVTEFATEVAASNIGVSTELLASAVQVLIKLEKSRSGKELLDRLLLLSDDDVDGLNQLLEEWSVRDALTVLDEIGHRLKLVDTIETLIGEPDVDELHVLHPLISQARWIFGPEFESAAYSSNLTLRSAVEKVFGKRLHKSRFTNARKRPDLVFLGDSALSVVGTEEFDESGAVTRLGKILVIELKRPDLKIGRDEITQAEHYIEDLLNCGILDGSPYVNAFVVGFEMSPLVTPIRRIGEQPERGRVQAFTLSQLIRTANVRLFNLRERFTEQYRAVTGNDVPGVRPRSLLF